MSSSTGRGSELPGAQLEIVVCRLRARALTPQPKIVKARKSSKKIPSAAIRRSRDIYWPDLKEKRATPVYDGERLESGNTVRDRRSSRPPTPRSSCSRARRSGSTRSAISS